MMFSHSHPIDAARYRGAWRRPIRQRRRLMVIVGKGERDAHIDHDWQTSLIAADADAHRADAFRQRAADCKHRRGRRAQRLRAFINS